MIQRRLFTSNGAGSVKTHRIKSTHYNKSYSDAKCSHAEVPSLSVQSACLASLVPLLAWVNTKTPVFHVNGDNIHVLYKPAKFYRTVKTQILGAKRRIVIASLYLGTGPLEKELVMRS